jgi:hypothetical protein
MYVYRKTEALSRLRSRSDRFIVYLRNANDPTIWFQKNFRNNFLKSLHKHVLLYILHVLTFTEWGECSFMACYVSRLLLNRSQ